MADGRIDSFRTMMTGELFSLLKKHSILAEQLQGEAEPDASFERRRRRGAWRARNCSRRLFGIRARHCLGEGEGDAASYASGLLIGSDVRAGLQPATAMGRSR